MSIPHERTSTGWLRGHDPETLRELIDPHRAQQRLRELNVEDTLAADAERVTLLRVLGDLDQALTLAGHTVQRALSEGTEAQTIGAQIRLGQVHQYRSETEAALLWLRAAFNAASSLDDPGLQSIAKVHEAKTLLEAHRPEDATGCLAVALELRTQAGASVAQCAPIKAMMEITEQRRMVQESSGLSETKIAPEGAGS